MREEVREYLRSFKLYFGILIGAIVVSILGTAAQAAGSPAVIVAALIGSIIGTALAKPIGYRSAIITGVITAFVGVLFSILIGKCALNAWLFISILFGAVGGIITRYVATSHTMRNVFRSPRFVIGFTIIMIIVLTSVFYPLFDTRNPMYSYGDMFLKPGTYMSVYDANVALLNSTTVHRIKNPDQDVIRWDSFISTADRETAIRFLARKYAWEQGYVVVSNTNADGSARDIEAYKAGKVEKAQAWYDEKLADYNKIRAVIDDPSTSDRQRTAYTNSRLPSAETALNKAKADLEKYSNNIINVDQAVDMWTNVFGLTTNPSDVKNIRNLWILNYEPLVNDENVPEGFGTGVGFIYNLEGGLELGSTFKTVLENVDRSLRIDPTQNMYFLQGAGAPAAMAKAVEGTGVVVEQADETVLVAEEVEVTEDEPETEGEGEGEGEATEGTEPEATEQVTETETAAAETEPVEEAVTAAEDDVNTVLEEAIANVEDDTLVSKAIGATNYVMVNEVANKVTFPLGTDNNGRDMLLLLVTAAGKSLLIGLLAGTIATLLGLFFGLLAGYVGGRLDDILTFIMNIFTVIPGFVLIIIIYNMVDKDQRGIVMCGTIIGITSWVWTARSVRSQVISLRNRDHVNLSKLSGHSLVRIILTDILPYIASYVVMAFILQVSSGILAEAQLSILGLGPSMQDGSTLGLMMNWAKLFGAYTSSNAWWAYFPVIGVIALISFSLNLMNTGLDQVFNPTLRD